MKLRTALIPLLLACTATAGARAADRPFEVRDLANLDRVSSPALSPDGRKVVFAVRETDFEANRGRTSLWIRDLTTRDLAPPRRFTAEGLNVNSPAFSADGSTVYFLSAKSGSQQVWAQPVAGGDARQVSDYPLDVGGYLLSPDGKAVALAFEVYTDCPTLACTTVTRGIDGDVPSKPFGGMEDVAWAPDGKSLAFSVRIAGRSEPWSTNFDIYRAAIDGEGAPVNLTASNPAWDAGPVFSADGRTLYYRAMKRPGFEADRFALMAMDLATGKSRDLDPLWDASADGIELSADGKRIYTTAMELGEHPLFSFDIAAGQATRVAGDGSISGFDLAGDTLVFTRNRMDSPDVLFAARDDGSAVRRISANNLERLEGIDFGEFEQFRFPGWNDETVHGYVLKPANYVPGKKYPVAFLIHGGPQGSFGNGWSYRWNPQTYAGQGFAVVMIDFHGSVGYGQAFTDAISGHWGDRPLEDLQKGWAAALAKYDFLDGDRACALGASYGGYMVNWIAGNWPQPWKCLVTHDGIFDTRMMAYATEELWFSEWENGGVAWKSGAAIEKFNPINFVDKWSVPMLVVHGALDYRIPDSQGIAVFTAAQRRGIESRLLHFPDENHWVLKPQNSVLWHDTVNAWIKRWTAQEQ